MGWDSSVANGLKDKAYAKPGVIFFPTGFFPTSSPYARWAQPGTAKIVTPMMSQSYDKKN